MTYCCAVNVNDGLVFASDTRTSAGVDDVRTYNKMHVFEYPGDRVFIIMSAGNLATTQTVLAHIARDLEAPEGTPNLLTMKHMFDVSEYIGGIVVNAQRHVLDHMVQETKIDIRTTLIVGGQIKGETPACYMIYPEGNAIATSPETPFLQIGESKYGKPILDRIIRPETNLNDAARCALVSLDSTMRSNLSVGPPLDLAIIHRDDLKVSEKKRFDLDTPYYSALKESWARNLDAVFASLPRFHWEAETPQSQKDLLVTPTPDSEEEYLTPAQIQAQVTGSKF